MAGAVIEAGFENGTPLHFRCACHGRSPAHNRSLLRNERPATFPAGLQSLRSANVTIQLPSFPFGCYTNPKNGSRGIIKKSTHTWRDSVKENP